MSTILPESFVYLDRIIPDIQVNLRYFSSENFIGRPIMGYHANRAILTLPTAEALQKAQSRLKEDGYALVVYDGYRPQQSVNHFIRWSEDFTDHIMQDEYFPRFPKAEVFERGFLAKRSSHSRGSAVDVSIIRDGQALTPLVKEKRQLTDGFEIIHSQDGTIDMGSPFDLFDDASFTQSRLISPQQQMMRDYLKQVMVEAGFDPYDNEWWHFTLQNEPYPHSYFDFPVA